MAGKVDEVEVSVLATQPTWGRNNDGQRHGELWHRIREYNTFIYAAVDGGYDALVDGVGECGYRVHLNLDLETVELTSDRPATPLCPRCLQHEIAAELYPPNQN